MNTRKLLIALAGLAMVTGAASAASAQTTFDQTHPRRAEVNHRLENQDRRINQERREGEIGPAKAYRLHRADRRMRREERRFARHDNGHITRGEQHRLNRQENAVSHRIGR
jgi:hypothetical protein